LVFRYFLSVMIVGVVFFAWKTTFSQNTHDTTTVINTGFFYDKLKMQDEHYRIAFSANPVSDPDKICSLTYTKPALPGGLVQGNMNAGILYIEFELINPSDSTEFLYFYPGFYFKSIHLFTEVEETGSKVFKTLVDSIPPSPAGNAYRVIQLSSGARVKIFAALQPIRINRNWLSPILIKPEYLNTHLTQTRMQNQSLDIVTYILVGILCMMLLYAMANYIQFRKEEYLYYSIYVLFTGFLLFTKSYLYHSGGDFTYFFEEYLDFIIMLTAVLCYVAFVRFFLNTDYVYPLLDKILKLIEISYVGFIVLYSLIYFFTPGVEMLNGFENGLKFLLLTGALLFVVLGFREKSKLVNFLAFGNLALLVFGMISLLIIIFSYTSESLWGTALFYYELAIGTELACFLFGLTYKGRIELVKRIKLEDARNLEEKKKDFERQLAIIHAQQEVRNRISTDLHDDLGGGITAIRLMSELAKQRMRDIHVPELEKISSSAYDLLGKMNAIIWSMNPVNDSLYNLVLYIRNYAEDFFENTDIQCIVLTDESLPVVEISGIKRRNIFLVIKEALNNVVKHARASNVIIQIEFDGRLQIALQDDGVGFDHEKIKPFANGLQNMEKRMSSIDGFFRLMNNRKGTLIVLETDI